MLIVLFFLLAANCLFTPGSARASGIRSLNFNEFSYRVGSPYCEEFGPTVKVHEGKFADEKATFEVSQVLYGNVTDSDQEQAVVVASCTPQLAAHPGFENGLVYVYGIKNGEPNLLAAFAFGQPWNLTGSATEARRDDQLTLFDVTGVSVGVASISFEHIAGKARCCPTFYVTQTFRWSNERFVLAREQKRPFKEVQTHDIIADGVEMQVQGGGDFAARYPVYVEAIRRRIAQNWLQSSIDPAARTSHTIHATVAFTINRQGVLKEVRIIKSSRNLSFNNAALRALLASNPVPPLPADYKGSYVSVTFDFPPPPR